MQKRLVGVLVQIPIYIVGTFKSEDHIGIVEETCEAICLSLFRLRQLLDGTQEFQQLWLAFSIEMNPWTCIHEMIAMEIEYQSVH
jgi:hypothetical protein